MVKDQWGYEHSKTPEESKFYLIEFITHESGDGLVTAIHCLKNTYEPLMDSGTMGIYVKNDEDKIEDTLSIDYLVALEDNYMIVSFTGDIINVFINALQENKLMISWL